MNGYVKYALGAAGLSVLAKLVYFFQFSPDEDWDMYVRFFYLLVFLIALMLGVREERSLRTTTFTDDVKSGMKVTSVYAMVLSLFTWLYYKFINPAYFAERINRVVTAATEAGQEDLENTRNTAEFIFNAFTHSTLTLFGMMVVGFFYTLVLVLLLRARPTSN